MTAGPLQEKVETLEVEISYARLRYSIQKHYLKALPGDSKYRKEARAALAKRKRYYQNLKAILAIISL